VHIPALLPQLGLPDPPAKPAPGAATSPIELARRWKSKTQMTLLSRRGQSLASPTGTSVQRDYATFGLSVFRERTDHHGLAPYQLSAKASSADRAADYNAFLRVVLSDEAQDCHPRPLRNPSREDTLAQLSQNSISYLALD